MRSRSVLSILLFIFLLVFLAQPASAGTIDTSIEVVSRGIQAFVEHGTAKAIANNYGVTFGNTSQMEDLTPAQKIVYMIAAAEHSPYEIKRVRDQVASDVVWYYIIMFFVLTSTFSMSMLQKIAPETVASITNKFDGHDSFFDYSVWFKTLLKLTILPIAAFPIIEGLLELEQGISTGLMSNAMEFLNTTNADPGIYFFEGIAYSFCGWFFAFRLQFINLFSAHILKVILLFAAAWWNSHYIAQVLGEWFITALAMRPVVLWYSCIAVQHIASINTNYGITEDMTPNEAYSQIWSTTFDVAGVTSIDMTLVIIASALTAAAALTWPIFKVIIKVIMGYLFGAIYKVMRVNNLLNKVRGN